MYDEDNKGQRLIKEARKLFANTERSNAENTWDTLAEFVVTSQNANFVGEDSKGIRKDYRLFDSTAILNNRDLASAMHSTITNPTMEWSKLRFKDDSMNDNNETSRWLSAATSMIHQYLNDSNFDSQIGRCYQSLSGFGTMAIYQEEVHRPDGAFDGFRFSAWHLGEIAICENAFGLVDRIYRKFCLTYAQAFERFGYIIGETQQEVEERLNNGKDTELEFYHVIYPRALEDVEVNDRGFALPNKRPFASCYIMSKGAKIVLEEGYYEFPVFIGRWSSLPGEVYGRGPGHDALPDVRTLNRLKRDLLKALAKSVNPPIITDQQNQFNSSLNPGTVVTVRNPEKPREFITQSRFDVSQIEVQALQASIRSAFYIDKLLLPPRTETGEMTAYEVSQRLEQMQQILGPVLSKLNSEFLTPFVMRCLKILFRNDMLPPLPASIPVTGGEIDFEVMFVNSLARSQQMSELNNVMGFVQSTAQIAAVKPEILDNLNADAILQYMASIRSIPPELLLSKEDVDKIRQQRQQLQEAQMGLNAGQQISEIQKNGQGGQ